MSVCERELYKEFEDFSICAVIRERAGETDRQTERDRERCWGIDTQREKTELMSTLNPPPAPSYTAQN